MDLSEVDGSAFSSSTLRKLSVIVLHYYSSTLCSNFEQSCAGKFKKLDMSMMGAVAELVVRKDGDHIICAVNRLPVFIQ